MNITSAFINIVTNPKKSVPKFVSQLKNESSYADLCKLLDSDSALIKRHLHFFLGNPLPKSYSELGRKGPIYESDNLAIELNWFMLAFRKYHKQIDEFLNYKIKFENALLIKEYSIARELLDKIETEICVSLWSLENRLLLAEISGGLSENKQTLNDLIAEGLHHDTQFLAHYYSIKVESEFSSQSYNDSIISAFDGYNEPDRNLILNYFLFKLDPFFSDWDFDAKDIIRFEVKFSVIDRYISLIKLSKLFFSGIIKLETDNNNLIARLEQILKKVNDPVVYNILNYVHKRTEYYDLEESRLVLQAKDQYILGNYTTCLKMCEENLRIFPQNFELLELASKSMLHLGLDHTTIFPTELNLRNGIIAAMVEMFRKKGDSRLYGAFLLKYSYSFESFDLAHKLLALSISEEYNDHQFHSFSILSDHHINSKFYTLFIDAQSQKSWLERYIQVQEGSVSLKYYYNAVSGNLDENLQLIPENELRKKSLIASSYINHKQFDTAAPILLTILEDCKDLGFLYVKNLAKLFNVYFYQQEYNKAIELFVSANLREERFTSKINTSAITTEIRNAKFRDVSPTIFLPIFCFLTKCDETETLNAIRLYLKPQGVEKPSDLLSKLQKTYIDEASLYVEYLLNEVCQPDVLRHFSIFKTPKEIYIERINILNSLRKFFPENETKYDSDLQLMTKKLIILDGMNKLDESKIYINEEGIYESELKQYDVIYQRLVVLVQTFSENNLKSLENSGIENNETDKPAYLSNLFAKNINLVIPSFKELFYEIRNHFLQSKFGLVTYLSTRIRHGVFEATLRPVFVKHNLVTLKNSQGDKYLRNTYWDQKLENLISDEKRDRFQTFLEEFSKSIDENIREILVKKLQIKTESKNIEGLLDYVFSEQEMHFADILNDAHQTFKEFAYKIFDILWSRTDANLSVIRSFIKKDVKSTFENALNRLENDSLKLFKSELLPEFFTDISLCRTFIEQELEKVSMWFLRSNSIMSDLRLLDIIDITYESFIRSHTEKSLTLIKEIDYNPVILGKYYVHFTDLLRLFLDNCLKHSSLPSSEVPLSISTHRQEDYLIIKISNPIQLESAALNELRNAISKIKEQMNDLEKMSKEGKSGFLKANKIIKSDFNSEDNEISFYIDQEFAIEIKLSIKILTDEGING